AALAERRNHRAGLGVERDQAVAGRHIEDALVALAVGPVGDAAARELARRDRGAVALAVAVRPDQFPGPAVEGDNRAARAGGGVQHALDRERRPFELVLGTGPEIVGLEAPGDFELVEVGGVDLIERDVAGAADVGSVVGPVAVLGARHPGRLALGPRCHPQRAGREQRHRRRHTSECLDHVCSLINEAPAQVTEPALDELQIPDADGYAAAVLFFARTSPKTCTAFCISSIVPSEMRAWVFSNGGKSRATITFLARQASRNALAGVPMLTNMKLAWQSVGFMPRSANHFVTMSRTALLRLRSLVVKLASCEIATVAAAMPNTFSEPVPLEPTQGRSFLIVSACAMA